MGLVLHVDGERWRAHLRATAERLPGLVPVVKGNGYGFGLGRLARRSQWLADQHVEGSPLDTIAVGTYEELPEVATRYDGDLLVLAPYRPFGAALDAVADDRLAGRLVHTVTRREDLADLLARRSDARLVLERLTTMNRHGMGAEDLWAAARETARARVEGVALHLPLSGSHLGEATRLLGDVAGTPLRTVWVSHLSADELATLRSRYPDFTVRPRVGTDLWLGDRGALRPRATVLDVHPLERGDVYGYRGRTAPRAGHLLVVSGGTGHGIGLEAPTGEQSVRSRAASLARGGLDAMGLTRSPFLVDAKRRLFAEPPHMQVSMLFLPAGARVPAIGEDVEVRVRYTATWFDEVVVS